MNQKELTKKFKLILNWKIPLVSIVYTQYFIALMVRQCIIHNSLLLCIVKQIDLFDKVARHPLSRGRLLTLLQTAPALTSTDNLLWPMTSDLTLPLPPINPDLASHKSTRRLPASVAALVWVSLCSRSWPQNPNHISPTKEYICLIIIFLGPTNRQTKITTIIKQI